MKLPRRMMVSSSALLVLLLALLDASAAANTTDDGTTTTTPPPPTPAPWGKLASGCESDKADKAAATPEYAACASDSGFSFDLSLNRRVTENVFCRSINCLKLFRTLRGISSDALRCAKVGGLGSVPLDTHSGATNCFGPAATDDSVNVIVRPGDQSSSGSGGAGETKKPTTAPPKPTTPVPTTPEPTTLAPETTSPMPTSAPKPTTKKPRTGSGSGSRGAPIVSVVTTPAPSTPTDTSNKKSDSGGLDSGTVVAIIGVSVGVVAVIIALVFVSTRKPKRRKKSNPHNSTHSRETVSHEQLTSYYGDPTNMRSGSYVPPRPTERASALVLTGGGGRGSMPWHSDGFGTAFAGWDEELIQAVRIPYEKLAFDELLSRGGYGEVYRGTYRGEPVAIKTLLPERRRDMQQIQSFLAEVKMMANMEHERIVHFIGVAWDSLEELSVVSEFLERGDLRTVLAGFERDRIRPHGFDADKIKIALHVAHGLTYMHTLQPVVLHRDLKSRNILLDNQLNAKITDFGVSRERSDSTMTAGVGSSLWMAPEVMMGERYDEKADIFSLGVVLSELDNHVLPYSHAIERTTGRRMPDPVILQMVSLGRMRVAFTDEAQSEMAQIGIRCVALSPRDRPTAAELLHLIHQASRRN